MSARVSSPLISTAELAARFGDADLRILDASWYMPADARDTEAEYRSRHIPGAVFFDIDGIAAPGTDLPHMVARPVDFAAAVGALGISESNFIVVYDTAGLLSAARAWWNFGIMGAERVFVLDGGLPRWLAEGRPVTDMPTAIAPARFAPKPAPEMAVDLATMRELVASRGMQIVDMRAAGRFHGSAPEPRPGLPSGHMPGARNMPFADLIADGRLKPDTALKTLIADAGIDPAAPLVTSCGSGLSAPIFNLALAKLGYDQMRVYDGSWTEWAGAQGVPIVTGGPDD